MKTILFGAGSDLGVHIDGASVGPIRLINDLKGFFEGEVISLLQKEDVIKSRNLSDKKKNEFEVNEFNEKLYQSINEVRKEDVFPICIGGDQSISIASVLSSANVYEDIGVILISAHAQYNNLDTTVTGNLQGMTLSAINGNCRELTDFYNKKPVPPTKTVVIGARSIDDWEKDTIKYSNITIFTTDDIKKEGSAAIVEKAYAIAGYRTKGVHISFNLDIMDPGTAPGVSIPEFDGLSEQETMQLCDALLSKWNQTIAFDLVDFNPLRDNNRKTEQIAVNILAKAIRKSETKGQGKNNF